MLKPFLRPPFPLPQPLTTSPDSFIDGGSTEGEGPNERMRLMGSATRVRWCVLLALIAGRVEARDALSQPRPECVTIRADETVPAVAARHYRRCAEHQGIVVPDRESDDLAMGAEDALRPRVRGVARLHRGSAEAGRRAAARDVRGRGAERSRRPPAPPAPPARRPWPAWPARPGASVVAAGAAVAWCALVVSIALTCWATRYFSRRERVRRAMEQFADRFVREFERPLVQQHLPDRPIQSRVRVKPARSRLDVLLAPHGGLRYPNLTDHKTNVHYDVARVQAVLRDHAFVSGRPYARGRWVVVPFQLRADIREAGGR